MTLVPHIIDNVPFELAAYHDFSFMQKYGTVFTVFDEQAFNVCFGVEKNGHKYFIKFAGAKPRHFYACSGDTDLAITWLKNACDTYQLLAHPNLIKYITSEAIGGGYTAIFEWTDAVGIEPIAGMEHQRFLNLPTAQKMKAFNDIVDFHLLVAHKGYVAIDFYDGSILYDYLKNQVMICDIDFYQKSPYVGDMGLWGSSRFVSPEECTLGGVMDEVTMVYQMGALAFSLFAFHKETDIAWRAQGEKVYRAMKFTDDMPPTWQLSRALYDVVRRAVQHDKALRQPSLADFITEWNEAALK